MRIGRERIVDVVGEPRREIAERRGALGALQPLLEHLALVGEPVAIEHLPHQVRQDREVAFFLHDVVVGAELHGVDGELGRRRGGDESVGARARGLRISRSSSIPSPSGSQ